MEIVVHSKNSMFQKSFIRNCTDSTGIPNLGVWCESDPIGLPEWDKKSDSDPWCR